MSSTAPEPERLPARKPAALGPSTAAPPPAIHVKQTQIQVTGSGDNGLSVVAKFNLTAAFGVHASNLDFDVNNPINELTITVGYRGQAEHIGLKIRLGYNELKPHLEELNASGMSEFELTVDDASGTPPALVGFWEFETRGEFGVIKTAPSQSFSILFGNHLMIDQASLDTLDSFGDWASGNDG